MKTPEIGILGGGQLGLMMAQAATNWHLEPLFLDPETKPAVFPYGLCQKGSFRDYSTVLEFGRQFGLVSFEIEDVNTQALFQLESEGIRVFPQTRVLEIIRNKGRQKAFLQENGFPTAPWKDYRSGMPADPDFFPSFWKQEEGGYDGKGVRKIKNQSDLASLPDLPGFLEKAVSIEKELAILVARSETGEVRTFPLVEMVFHPTAHLVEYLQTPAIVDAEIESICSDIATALIKKLEMTGLLAVEFFLDVNGKVLVNELAPRPHNSGHHTIETHATSQFEQYWRAILGLPLGETRPVYAWSAMLNLVGEPDYTGPPVYEGLEKVLDMDRVWVHLYGKAETRPFRKMGHITLAADSLADLKQKVSFVQNQLKVIA
jgi:5-(carboxyamino)imidazole ribonucleotide synthase